MADAGVEDGEGAVVGEAFAELGLEEGGPGLFGGLEAEGGLVTDADDADGAVREAGDGGLVHARGPVADGAVGVPFAGGGDDELRSADDELGDVGLADAGDFCPDAVGALFGLDEDAELAGELFLDGPVEGVAAGGADELFGCVCLEEGEAGWAAALGLVAHGALVAELLLGAVGPGSVAPLGAAGSLLVLELAEVLDAFVAELDHGSGVAVDMRGELHAAVPDPGVLAGLVAAWDLDVLGGGEEVEAVLAHARGHDGLLSLGGVADGLELLVGGEGPGVLAAMDLAGHLDGLELLEFLEAVLAHAGGRRVEGLAGAEVLELLVLGPEDGVVAALDSAGEVVVLEFAVDLEAVVAESGGWGLAAAGHLLAGGPGPGVLAAA